MKIWLYVVVFLVCLANVLASNVATAEVHVSVINDPPVITAVSILPEAYEGASLDCEAAFQDELEKINLNYKWYKNGALIGKERILHSSNFDVGDVVTCEVVPNDFVQDGEAKSISVDIKPKPFLSGITGAVVGVGQQVGFLNTFLILVLIALVILGVSYFFKRK